MMSKLYIGISGLAFSGKDLCGKIIINYLTNLGMSPQRFALADELKVDVEEFLNVKCHTSPYTDDVNEKSKIRNFLVWYGCYQRGVKPDYWIKKIEKSIELDSQCDAVIVPDIRFPNEAHWIHSKEGWLIHLSKYTKESPDGGRTWKRIYQKPPNIEEETNDPIVKRLSDFCINWEDMSNNGSIKVNPNDLVNNIYLKEEALKSIQACPGLSHIQHP